MSEENKIKNKSNDRQYFTVTPRIVWAKCRNVYDKSLWETVKSVAGDDGECYLTTVQLASLSMMSKGQVSKSRKHLVNCGLLTGHITRDEGYPQAVWHLSIPDLWEENIEWAKKHKGIRSRIRYKEEQKNRVSTVNAKGVSVVKPPSNENPQSGEGSHHEPKKNQSFSRRGKKEKKENPQPREREEIPKMSPSLIFEQVTGFPPLPQQASVIGEIFENSRGEFTADYLQIYWDEWNKRGYRRQNISWLDWAAKGEIPAKSRGGKSKSQRNGQLTAGQFMKQQQEANR